MKLTQEQSKLVEENHKLIYGFLTKYKLPEDEWYDLCAIGLIKAAQLYESGKGEFSTLAYKYMFNDMRVELMHRNRYFPEILSTDLEYENEDGGTYTMLDMCKSDINIENDIITRFYINEIKNFFDENLKKDTHKKIIELILFKDKDKYEASKEVGISRQAFEQGIKRISKKYKRKFGEI